MKEILNTREVYAPPEAEFAFLGEPLRLLRSFSADARDWQDGDDLDGDWEYDEDFGDFLDGGTAGNDGY